MIGLAIAFVVGFVVGVSVDRGSPQVAEECIAALVKATTPDEVRAILDELKKGGA